MVDQAISALPPAGAITGAEIFPLVQSGVTSQATLAALAAGLTSTINISQTSDWTANTVDLGGGRRQLQPGASYVVVGPVTRSFTLVTNGFSKIFGVNPLVDTDTYTGIADCYEIPTGFTESLNLTNMGSTCSDDAATWMNQADSLGLFLNSVIVSAKLLGTLGAIAFFCAQSRFGNSVRTVLTGFTVTQATGTSFFIRDSGMNPDPAQPFTAFTLGTSVYGDFRMESNSFVFAAAHKVLSGLAGGGNVSKGGFVINNDFTFADDPLIGISPKDDPWNFQDNAGNVKNSDAIGCYVLDAPTDTIITDTSWEKILGTTTTCSTLERYDQDLDNELTYTSNTQVSSLAQAVITLEKAGGATACELAFFVDTGSGFAIIPESVVPVNVTTVVQSTNVMASLNTSPGDKIDTRIRNLANTNNITIDSINMITYEH